MCAFAFPCEGPNSRLQTMYSKYLRNNNINITKHLPSLLIYLQLAVWLAYEYKPIKKSIRLHSHMHDFWLSFIQFLSIYLFYFQFVGFHVYRWIYRTCIDCLIKQEKYAGNVVFLPEAEKRVFEIHGPNKQSRKKLVRYRKNGKKNWNLAKYR